MYDTSANIGWVWQNTVKKSQQEPKLKSKSETKRFIAELKVKRNGARIYSIPEKDMERRYFRNVLDFGEKYTIAHRFSGSVLLVKFSQYLWYDGLFSKKFNDERN